MIAQRASLEGASVVIRGYFNPPIFSPKWFFDQQLIGAAEFRASEIEVITRDVAFFGMGWLGCQVSSETLQLTTTNPEEFERLRDAAIGVLRLLSHTPVAALGINREFHVHIERNEDYHAIGDALTPKFIWEKHLKLPGMKSVTIEGLRPDDYNGRVQVQVAPSVRVKQGVYIGHNDHFSLGSNAKTPRTRDEAWSLEEEAIEPSADYIASILSILSDEWKSSMSRADKLADLIVGLTGH